MCLQESEFSNCIDFWIHIPQLTLNLLCSLFDHSFVYCLNRYMNSLSHIIPNRKLWREQKPCRISVVVTHAYIVSSRYPATFMLRKPLDFFVLAAGCLRPMFMLVFRDKMRLTFYYLQIFLYVNNRLFLWIRFWSVP